MFFKHCLKLNTIHKCPFYVPIKDRAQRYMYASSHSNFHEFLSSHDAGKA